MSEKIGGAKGTALDEEFVEMERVRITKIHNHNCYLHVFGPDWNIAALTHYHTMLHFRSDESPKYRNTTETPKYPYFLAI